MSRGARRFATIQLELGGGELLAFMASTARATRERTCAPAFIDGSKLGCAWFIEEVARGERRRGESRRVRRC